MPKPARIYTGTGPLDFVEVPIQGPNLAPQVASRSSAANEYSFGALLPNPDSVLKKTGRDVAVYRDLRVDPKVGSCIHNRQAGLLSQEWDIDRGQSKSRVTKFVKETLERLPMDAIMSEMLEATLYGYKPIEIVWEQVNGAVLPVQVIGMPQEWFRFDAQNHLRYITKDSPDGLDTTLPEYRFKFLCPRHRPSYANPYGEPLLAMVFWYVAFKKGGLRFWVTMTEKFGMPYLVAKYRQGADDAERATLLDALQKMIQDACAVIPEGDSVEAMEFSTSSSSADLYEKLLRYCDEQASVAILGHPGTSTSTPGKLGEETASIEVRKDLVDADKRLVSEAMDRLIRWIVDLNFGPNVDAPHFGIYEEEKVDKTQAERDKLLHETGVRFKEQYVQRVYGFEDGDIEMSSDQTPPALQPGATPGQPPVQFARGDASDGGQDEIDALVDGLPPSLLQQQMEQVLAPLIEMVQHAESLEQIQTKAAELFPKLDSSDLEKTLQKAFLLAETWGRLNGGK